MHPNIIPLYDCFVLPATQELYFVFEPMEGSLYQLIKSRKGKKNFAGGLVASIFQQTASALDHVHSNGYFHCDVKPENLLVTTTGLVDYASTLPLTPDASEPDVKQATAKSGPRDQ
ncbi:cdk-related kinase, partial [Rhizoctonia solani AG-3 Rhs1AP]